MFEEEGSHYWILAILFVGIFVIIAGLYLFGIIRLNAPPDPPTNIQITQIQNALKITWQNSSSPDVIGYNIYRSKQYSIIGDKINSEIIKNNEWVDSSLFEDGTYYYLVKAVDYMQEDEGLKQVSYYYDTAPPYNSKISINNDETYTGSKQVKLYLSSVDSHLCRYQNENGSWSSYSPYATVKNWELKDEEGIRLVYYQCEDKNKNIGPIVSDFITLDKTKPIVSFIKPVESIYSEESEIEIEFEVKDNYPNTILCSIYLNEMLIQNLTNPFENSLINFNFLIEQQEKGNYSLILSCEDEAGNENIINKTISVVSFGEYKSKEINISINNGAEKTEEREVKLYLSSSKADLCRFRNEQRTWSDWEPYKNTVEWVLSSTDGIKTVYVECLNKNNISIGTNWDSINYDPKDSNGGSEINCNKEPYNLNIKINEDDKCTNELDVSLSLDAVCADECTYREVDSGIWKRWIDYRTYDSFSLGARYSEGLRTIEYKCKNNFGESDIVSASILYDITPPTTSVYLEGQAKENGKIQLSWEFQGERDGSFNIYRKSLEGRTFSYVDNTQQTSWVDYDTYNGQEYEYYVVIEDCAGNEGTTPSNVVSITADSEKPEITIYSPYEGEEFTNKNILVEFEIEDELSDLIDCKYQAGGNKKSLGTYYPGQYVSENIALSPSSSIASGDERIRIYLYCEDEAGNEEVEYVSVVYIHEIEIDEEDVGPGPID